MAAVQSAEHADLLDQLIADVESYKPDVDRTLLEHAFAYAAHAHESQKRQSGEPFIEHPFAVARILAELHLDEETLAAALLHDVVEDTGIDADQLKAEFGEEITKLVDGVTKL